MRILVFDTETTGLPPSKWLKNWQLKDWPYIIQLAFILYDTEEQDILYDYNEIIKLPKEAILSRESTKVHGITRRDSARSGVNIMDGLKLFKLCLELADDVVAHNLEFDINMIRAECVRNNFRLNLFNEDERAQIQNPTKRYTCTMKAGKDICNIQAISKKDGEKYIKFPSLTELYTTLYTIPPEGNLHDAFVDTAFCLKCYLKLMNN